MKLKKPTQEMVEGQHSLYCQRCHQLSNPLLSASYGVGVDIDLCHACFLLFYGNIDAQFREMAEEFEKTKIELETERYWNAKLQTALDNVLVEYKKLQDSQKKIKNKSIKDPYAFIENFLDLEDNQTISEENKNYFEGLVNDHRKEAKNGKKAKRTPAKS